MRLLVALATIVSLGGLHAQNYVRDVYPIWQKHCLGCHASGTKMGSLDIETWEGIQHGGNHGTMKGGRHLAYPSKTIPTGNLLLSLLDQFEIERESIGDSTGRLTNI